MVDADGADGGARDGARRHSVFHMEVGFQLVPFRHRVVRPQFDLASQQMRFVGAWKSKMQSSCDVKCNKTRSKINVIFVIVFQRIVQQQKYTVIHSKKPLLETLGALDRSDTIT